jgi:hypothetical protein
LTCSYGHTWAFCWRGGFMTPKSHPRVSGHVAAGRKGSTYHHILMELPFLLGTWARHFTLRCSAARRDQSRRSQTCLLIFRNLVYLFFWGQMGTFNSTRGRVDFMLTKPPNILELASQHHCQSLGISSDAALELSPLRAVFLILPAEPLVSCLRKM